jgi:type IV secretion system protein VirD4
MAVAAAARAANRFLGKADREAASVMSNAQRHTHFLDSPRIARVKLRSDFHFSELRHRITSVFLVPPPNRMDAYPEVWLARVLERIQDHPANRIGALMPWEYQAMVEEQKAEPA